MRGNNYTAVAFIGFITYVVFISDTHSLNCLTCGPDEARGVSPCNTTIIKSDECKSHSRMKPDGDKFACILMIGEDQDLQQLSEARFCAENTDGFTRFIKNGKPFEPKMGNCYSDLRIPHELNPNITYPIHVFCICETDNCNSLVGLTKSSQVNKS